MTVLITQMYMAHPQLVSNAAANTEGQVSQGFFFGEDESGNVSAYFVIVEVTDVRLGVPQVRAVRGVIRLPYSPTRITEELMEGTTERAKRVQADWLIEQKHIPEQDKKWRWLQYVVKRTGDFDDVRVGGSVEVIEVQKGHSPHWLAQQSCSR